MPTMGDEYDVVDSLIVDEDVPPPCWQKLRGPDRATDAGIARPARQVSANFREAWLVPRAAGPQYHALIRAEPLHIAS